MNIQGGIYKITTGGACLARPNYLKGFTEMYHDIGHHKFASVPIIVIMLQSEYFLMYGYNAGTP